MLCLDNVFWIYKAEFVWADESARPYTILGARAGLCMMMSQPWLLSCSHSAPPLSLVRRRNESDRIRIRNSLRVNCQPGPGVASVIGHACTLSQQSFRLCHIGRTVSQNFGLILFFFCLQRTVITQGMLTPLGACHTIVGLIIVGIWFHAAVIQTQ